MLPFTAIHRQLHRVTGSETEGLVTMQQRLHVVVPRLQFRKAAHRITKGAFIHQHFLPRLHSVHVHAKDHLRVR